MLLGETLSCALEQLPPPPPPLQVPHQPWSGDHRAGPVPAMTPTQPGVPQPLEGEVP